MVRAHRQAWAWQDEWVDLTMDDIREIEKETQLALQKKMGNDDNSNSNDDDDDDDDGKWRFIFDRTLVLRGTSAFVGSYVLFVFYFWV